MRCVQWFHLLPKWRTKGGGGHRKFENLATPCGRTLWATCTLRCPLKEVLGTGCSAKCSRAVTAVPGMPARCMAQDARRSLRAPCPVPCTFDLLVTEGVEWPTRVAGSQIPLCQFSLRLTSGLHPALHPRPRWCWAFGYTPMKPFLHSAPFTSSTPPGQRQHCPPFPFTLNTLATPSCSPFHSDHP